jgi:hypothetical protein
MTNKATIERIAAAAVRNLPVQVAQQFANIKGLLDKASTEDEVSAVYKRTLDLVKEEFQSIEGLHNTVAEALLPYAEDTDLLDLLEKMSQPETVRKLGEIQTAMVREMTPYILSVGERVGERVAGEFRDSEIHSAL